MYMDESEIIREYKEARRPGDQVIVMADLNLCHREDILRVLILSGADISPAGPYRYFGTGKDKTYSYLKKVCMEMLESADATDQRFMNAMRSMEMYLESANRKAAKRKKKAS